MSYIGRQPVPQASRYLQEGTISTPTNEISVVGGYGVNNIHVYINGVLLPTDEYTANDGSKIVFDEPLPGGTKFRIEEFRTFEVAEFGTAAKKNVATEAEAIDGTPDVLVDAAGLKSVLDNRAATPTALGGLKARLDGDILYLRNDSEDA